MSNLNEFEITGHKVKTNLRVLEVGRYGATLSGDATILIRDMHSAPEIEWGAAPKDALIEVWRNGQLVGHYTPGTCIQGGNIKLGRNTIIASGDLVINGGKIAGGKAKGRKRKRGWRR